MTKYIYNPIDGSYFGLDQGVIIDVPEDIDGEDIEDYLKENSENSISIIDLYYTKIDTD